jgi:hypothetical protein
LNFSKLRNFGYEIKRFTNRSVHALVASAVIITS